MSTSRATRAPLLATGSDHRVTPAELFFDLVFVFAITQVTELMADEVTARHVAEGVLLLCWLWWCWCCFAWLGNVVRADVGMVRVVLFVVMALVLVIAIVVPESFEDLPGGLHGPTAFVVCYLLVRLLHLSVYWISDPHDRALHLVLLRSAASLLPSAALAFAGAIIGGDAQLLLWTAAFVLDFIGIYLTGSEGWRIASPGHWAERHALIVIVALGESIVALGVGVTDLPLSWSLVATTALGVAVAASFWALYFDGPQEAGEHALDRVDGARRTALARDGYTYLHLSLIAGIVISAVGLKKVAEYVGDIEHHDLADAITGLAAWMLPGGAAIYLLGTTAFVLRANGRLQRRRLAVGLGLLVAGFLVPYVPALLALLGLAVVLATLAVAEARSRREAPADA